LTGGVMRSSKNLTNGPHILRFHLKVVHKETRSLKRQHLMGF
jgi:hypothetical protein